MNTVTTDQWAELAQRQTERALAGDQQAAAWCAKHAPGTAPDDDGTSAANLNPEQRWLLGQAEKIKQCVLRDDLARAQGYFGMLYSETFFCGFTREELKVVGDHIDAREATPAALGNHADVLREALARALAKDQDPSEIRANKWDCEHPVPGSCYRADQPRLDGEKTE